MLLPPNQQERALNRFNQFIVRDIAFVFSMNSGYSIAHNHEWGPHERRLVKFAEENSLTFSWSSESAASPSRHSCE